MLNSENKLASFRTEHLPTLLLNDRELGRLIGSAPSTIRVQRHRRKNGLEHWLTLDPVFLGSSPRYRPEQAKTFIDNLKTIAPSKLQSRDQGK